MIDNAVIEKAATEHDNDMRTGDTGEPLHNASTTGWRDVPFVAGSSAARP